MTVGLKVSSIVIEIGPSSILTAFFSSIHCNLEDGEWGSRYPVLLKEFYSGNLAAESGNDALDELSSVGSLFNKMPTCSAVWDFDQLEIPRPKDLPFAADAENLSEFFITNNRKPLIEVIESRLLLMIKKNRNMTIDTTHFKFLSEKK